MRFFTLHFTENVISESAAVVKLDVEEESAQAPGVNLHVIAGSLVMSVDEWDRVWRALKNSTAIFEREGISLKRTHSKERM